LSFCGQAQSPQQNIFFLCAASGEGFLTERAVNLTNHALLSLRGAHNPGVNIIPSIEIFRYSKELDPHRQPTSGTEGCSDSLGRGKLRSAASPGARLSDRGPSRTRRSQYPAPPRAYSHCVARPAFMDPSAGGQPRLFPGATPLCFYWQPSVLGHGLDAVDVVAIVRKHARPWPTAVRIYLLAAVFL
jgi:hypothetical protein